MAHTSKTPAAAAARTEKQQKWIDKQRGTWGSQGTQTGEYGFFSSGAFAPFMQDLSAYQYNTETTAASNAFLAKKRKAEPNNPEWQRPDIVSGQWNTAAMKRDLAQLQKYGDEERGRTNLERHGSYSGRPLEGERFDLGLKDWQYEAAFGQNVHGRSWGDVAGITRGMYRTQGAMLERKLGELQGIKAAGGPEAYAEQQSAAAILSPIRQREAAKAAEQARMGGGASPGQQQQVASTTGGQATAAVAAEQARGGRARGGGGGRANRYLRTRTRARKILQPLGGSAVLG